MTVIEELVVDYDPRALQATVQRRRRLMRGRLISLAVTLAIMVVFYLWQRAQFTTALFVVYGIVLLVSAGLLVFRFVSYRRAAAELAQVRPGPAIRIGRGGVAVGPVGAPWSQVGSLRVVGRGLGREQALQLQATSGARGLVPLDQVNVFPATLDSAARAYSAGRVGVDLSALDT